MHRLFGARTLVTDPKHYQEPRDDAAVIVAVSRLPEGDRVSLGQPNHLGVQSMSRAFSTFAHVAGYVCLTGAFLMAAGYQSADPALGLWPALAGLAAMIASLWVLDRKRTVLWASAFLVVGGLVMFFVAVSVFAGIPDQASTNSELLSLVKYSLILVGGAGIGIARGIIWSVAGFVVAEGVTLGAALVAGGRIEADVSAMIGVILVVAVYAFVGVTGRYGSAVQPRLNRAALDEHVSGLRNRVEQRAAALMHDTVLGHLAGIATASGELSAELRTQIERDLQVLVGEEWLSDPTPEFQTQASSDWRRSALYSAIEEGRSLGLQIDVTGELSAVNRLDSSRGLALGLATKQCLVNVLKHAQVDRAEIVVVGSESDVCVMVVDSGRGFSADEVGADRLGLRQSVRRRIEAVDGDVQVWSTLGRGTSVMIRVPTIETMDAVQAHD
ncbi:MAG: ATP-binding protein [Glaciihabitans sp.]|nr:ATP-binding protein [Glaciihabitans sp.]